MVASSHQVSNPAPELQPSILWSCASVCSRRHQLTAVLLTAVADCEVAGTWECTFVICGGCLGFAGTEVQPSCSALRQVVIQAFTDTVCLLHALKIQEWPMAPAAVAPDALGRSWQCHAMTRSMALVDGRRLGDWSHDASACRPQQMLAAPIVRMGRACSNSLHHRKHWWAP